MEMLEKNGIGKFNVNMACEVAKLGHILLDDH